VNIPGGIGLQPYRWLHSHNSLEAYFLEIDTEKTYNGAEGKYWNQNPRTGIRLPRTGIELIVGRNQRDKSKNYKYL